jgi:hypothetical protein
MNVLLNMFFDIGWKKDQEEQELENVIREDKNLPIKLSKPFALSKVVKQCNKIWNEEDSDIEL